MNFCVTIQQSRNSILQRLFGLAVILLSIAGSKDIQAQSTDLYVGSNSSSQTTNFTPETNSYSNTYIGYNAGASNNLLIIANSGTLLTNSDTLYVGYNGSSNSMVISGNNNLTSQNIFWSLGVKF